jgi:hypothetical protein
MTRMLGLVQVKTNDKSKSLQGPQRNKDKSIPRQDPRREGGEVDLPMDSPVSQTVNPSRGVEVDGSDPIGGEGSENGPRKARETISDGPNSATKEADPAL